MPSTLTINPGRRAGSLDTLVRDVIKDMLPAKADAFDVLERQRVRIIERTERGLDYEGRPFAPYSTRGPYYYTPSEASPHFARVARQAKLFPHIKIQGYADMAARERDRRIRARDRFAKKIAGSMAGVAAAEKLMATQQQFRSAPIRGLKFKREGLSIRFESYGAFKRSLGRLNVDLTGVSAPHMLHSIVSKVEQVGDDFTGTLGIYGQEAARAEAHNEGVPSRGLPQRRFLDASRSDIEESFAELDMRRARRLNR